MALDTVKLLGYPEDKIKKVEEALSKYKTVDEAMNEIRRLSIEDHSSSNSRHKVVLEDMLLHHLDEGWTIVRELNHGKIIIGRETDTPILGLGN